MAETDDELDKKRPLMKDVLDQIDPDTKMKDDDFKEDGDSQKNIASPIGDMPGDQEVKDENSQEAR